MFKSKTSLIEFIKFGIAGVFNTLIDFAVLNGFIYAFGLGSNNGYYILFKTISFAVAVTNSYFMNKLWVFKNTSKSTSSQEFINFLGVSVVGLLINISVSSFLFKFGPDIYPFSNHVWANIGALIGTGAVLLWNFVGYKLFVFKNKKEGITINRSV